MTYPKISIVTPNFNGAKYIEETILSILGQNYPNLEYIIIDGGSTDNSVEIIKKYESQLAYWVSEPDKGLYDAIQKGFDKSTGEIMAWLNSDDMYHKNSFFSVSEIFSNFRQVNWLTAIPNIIDESGRTVTIDNYRKWSKLDYYLGNFEWIQQESTFWRRSLWEVAGSKVAIDMKYAGDLELWLRFFRYEQLYITRALVAGFRMRTDGQLSVAFINEYYIEARTKIQQEIDFNIPNIEKKLINIIKRINALIDAMPHVFLKKGLKYILYRAIGKKISKHFGTPRAIYFQRSTQKFKI